ncbi:MvdC/MvdD family ATP grasp protein [Streptomyces sp. H51]|uniref:MvdC/MvdD family ATP grasp protein n=1 Tax=Streptomyces sp. H51 TaxID=3111770 RepID=UPI002D7A33B0|nr:hypothetical protein [Streptomyces sp. H51]
MILIISDPQDATVHFVLPHLERFGAEVLWWNEDRFPAESRLTLQVRGGLPRALLHTGGATHDLADVTAVWVRRPGHARTADSVREPTHRAWAEHVSTYFLRGLTEILPARRWMPGPVSRAAVADNKLVNLTRAAELGFTVPDTLVTNDPDELVPAWETAGGRLISKTLTCHDVRVDGERHHMHTVPVRRRDLAGRARIRHAPVILQPDVPQRVALRVTVVAGEVFAAETDSHAARTGGQDRRHHQDAAVACREHRLPDEVRRRCAALVESLGLSYGAIDLALTPDGDYVFLEIDVNGRWGWVETLTGMPIAHAVADWLSADEPARGSAAPTAPDQPAKVVTP